MFITAAAELLKVICSVQNEHFKYYCGTVLNFI